MAKRRGGLTVLAVENLKAKDVRYEVPDPGCLCIATPPTNNTIQIPPGVPASGARFYNAPGAQVSAGDVLDVAGDASGDAIALVNTGFFAILAQSGTTAERPTYPAVGSQFADTSLSKLITFAGTAGWRDVTGASV